MIPLEREGVIMIREVTKQDRFSSHEKEEAVLRLLRGEDLEALSRELGVPAALLLDWRERFLTGGWANLEYCEPDAKDKEIERLKSLVEELYMRLELLGQAKRRLEDALSRVRCRAN